MPENRSRKGKEVEKVSISDEPHEKYRGFDPWTGEKLEVGIPILTSKSHGNVIEKDVTYYTVKCPSCNIPAEYTHDSEPLCPNCGIVCAGENTILSEQMVRDSKAAGRFEGN